MFCRMLFPETELEFIKGIEFGKKNFDPVVHCSLKNFTKIRQQRNWPIIGAFSAIIFFYKFGNLKQILTDQGKFLQLMIYLIWKLLGQLVDQR